MKKENLVIGKEYFLDSAKVTTGVFKGLELETKTFYFEVKKNTYYGRCEDKDSIFYKNVGFTVLSYINPV